MDADDCARADWQRLGEQDAGQGHSLDRLDDRAKACREHGHGADRAAYEAGHRIGQRAYCSAARGERHALRGETPARLCLEPQQADYERGFSAGLQTFCRARKAYEHGRAGGDDPRTCPESWRLDFETGWRLGREVRDFEQRRQRALAEAEEQRRRAENTQLKPEDRELARRRAAEALAQADRLRERQRNLEIQALTLPR
ncbi:MAG: DUF2799 domain-containing protein [Burkholderiales bacterium]|nr:DUF2799 domain-containing protein [Burkholderiales bacterium]